MVSFTVPLICPTIIGYFETHVIIVSLNTFGQWLTHNGVNIGHTSALHWTGIVASLADFSDDYAFIFDFKHFVVVNIGLVISFLTFY